jgi:hypothetical protein
VNFFARWHKLSVSLTRQTGLRGKVLDALFGRQIEPTELVDNFVANCPGPRCKAAWALGFIKLPQF